MNDFFSDENVISRIQNCGTYFENIKTVAFDKVCNILPIYYLSINTDNIIIFLKSELSFLKVKGI